MVGIYSVHFNLHERIRFMRNDIGYRERGAEEHLKFYFVDGRYSIVFAHKIWSCVMIGQ